VARMQRSGFGIQESVAARIQGLGFGPQVSVVARKNPKEYE